MFANGREVRLSTSKNKYYEISNHATTITMGANTLANFTTTSTFKINLYSYNMRCHFVITTATTTTTVNTTITCPTATDF